jgi:phytoene dehydrogenase-like protein
VFVFGAAVRADVIPAGEDCHHIFLDDWALLEASEGVLFVSIPSLLDDTLCPAGTHIVHVFTPYWMEPWKVSAAGLAACLLAQDNKHINRKEYCEFAMIYVPTWFRGALANVQVNCGNFARRAYMGRYDWKGKNKLSSAL